MNFKTFITTFAVTGALLLSTGVVNASGSQCQIIYGGGEVCNTPVQFSLSKMVEVPGKGGGDFVKNLSVNDQKFAPGQAVTFKIVITNTGSTNITHASVVDTFPQYLTFVSGNGHFDQNARTLTFDVNNLNAGQAQEFIITAKVVDDSQLPQDQGTICVVNQVNATEDSGATAADSSQLCIARQVLGAVPTPQVFTTVPPKAIPNTGPELYSLALLIPTGLTGFALRKKSKLS